MTRTGRLHYDPLPGHLVDVDSRDEQACRDILQRTTQTLSSSLAFAYLSTDYLSPGSRPAETYPSRYPPDIANAATSSRSPRLVSAANYAHATAGRTHYTLVPRAMNSLLFSSTAECAPSFGRVSVMLPRSATAKSPPAPACSKMPRISSSEKPWCLTVSRAGWSPTSWPCAKKSMIISTPPAGLSREARRLAARPGSSKCWPSVS